MYSANQLLLLFKAALWACTTWLPSSQAFAHRIPHW